MLSPYNVLANAVAQREKVGVSIRVNRHLVNRTYCKRVGQYMEVGHKVDSEFRRAIALAILPTDFPDSCFSLLVNDFRTKKALPILLRSPMTEDHPLNITIQEP